MYIDWHWPQITLVVWYIIHLLASAHFHGRVKEHPNNKYNFWANLIRAIVLCTLLYYGGFFN